MDEKPFSVQPGQSKVLNQPPARAEVPATQGDISPQEAAEDVTTRGFIFRHVLESEQQELQPCIDPGRNLRFCRQGRLGSPVIPSTNKQIHIQRYQFFDKVIAVLKDRATTRVGILAAFDKLVGADGSASTRFERRYLTRSN